MTAGEISCLNQGTLIGGWNRKQAEVQMILGVYVYVIEYELHNSDKKVKGEDVTLIR